MNLIGLDIITLYEFDNWSGSILLGSWDQFLVGNILITCIILRINLHLLSLALVQYQADQNFSLES